MTNLKRDLSPGKNNLEPPETDARKKDAANHIIEADRRFHATILDNIKDSVIATDLQGRITYWNQGAQGTFGYSSAEMLGEPVTRLSRPKEKKKDAATRLDFLEHGISSSVEWEGRHKEGTPVFLNQTYLPMRNKEGLLLGLACIGKDITGPSVIG